MIKLFITFLLIVGLSGCGSKEPTDTYTGTKIIVDTDTLTDQDDMAANGIALAMMKQGKINVIGFAMAGVDINNRRAMGISAITHYYGYPHIPVSTSYNPKVRTMHNKFAPNNPRLSPKYLGEAKDLSHFKSDGLLDDQRESTTAMYCRLLTDNTGVVIVIVGQTYNISDLINETTLCNGKELLATKVKELVINGGTIGRSWDMNTGAHSPFHTYTAWSTRHVYDTMTNLGVRIVNTSARKNYTNKVGPIYQEHNINSPMAFAYGTYYSPTKTYIEIGSESPDSLAVVYTGYPEYWNTVLEGSAVFDKHAVMTWNYGGKGSSDYIVNTLTPEDMDGVLNTLMSIEP